MKFTVKGRAYEMLSFDMMLPAEAEDMEDELGVSMSTVARAVSTCVCGHRDLAHWTEEEQGGPVGSCRKCDCDQMMSGAPAKYSNVMVWVSMRREDPALTFEVWRTTVPYADVVYEPENPTGEPTVSEPAGPPTPDS